MANHRQPSIRDKGPKGFTVRWGSPARDFYLAKDRATAEKLFLDPASTHPGSLAAWQRWVQAKHAKRAALAGGHSSLQLIDASLMFLDAYDAQDRVGASDYFKTGLARFLRLHGEQDLLELTTPAPKLGRFKAPIIALLDAFKADLSHPPARAKVSRLKPKTINHDLTSVMRLINWCAEQGLCPEVSWKGFKKLPTRRGTPDTRSPEELGAMLTAVGETDPRVIPYLALGYLACLRPSEAPKLLALAGDFVPTADERGKHRADRGAFKLAEHKNSWRNNEDLDRVIVLSEEALEWLTAARALWPSRPPWLRLDNYSAAAVASGCDPGPRMMRDSAASHLLARGVPLEDVKTLLGHVPPGEWRSYGALPWHSLRRQAARISLRSVLWPPTELAARVQAFAHRRAEETSQAIRKGIARRDRKRRKSGPK